MSNAVLDRGQGTRATNKALVTHPNHNYYFGRQDADITPWLDYFLKGMAMTFEQVSEELRNEMFAEKIEAQALSYLRALDHRARRVFGLFSMQETIRSIEVAGLLSISMRQARNLLTQWVKDGWLEIADHSKKGRKYRLVEDYRGLISR